MNIFRFVADMLHVTAICILMYRIRKSRNCIGKYINNQEALIDYYHVALAIFE